MLNLLIIWALIGSALLLVGTQERYYSAGMPLGYFLGLSLIHAPGAAVYLNFPEWDVQARWTYLGFQETVLGMAAFLVGVFAVRQICFLKLANEKLVSSSPIFLARWNRIAIIYLAAGTCYFGLGSVLHSVSSLSAILAQLVSVLIVGVSLMIWVARQEGNYPKFWLTLAMLPLLPLVSVIRDGFIGFGTYWMLSSLSFIIAQSRRRLVVFLAAPVVIFFGLSLFVNYMASRAEYRQAVWFRQVSLEERFERVGNMFRNFEWYNSENWKHREVVDGRLNQNLVVGAAVERLEAGAIDYKNGGTLVEMIIALIPRAIWPGKPSIGGGGSVVSDFAGMRFAEGTSVGAGQVLEFYINFGVWGIIGGFLIYGGLIGWMDVRIMHALHAGDQQGFLLWFMICLAMLQPGGNLLEIVTSAAGSAVIALLFSWILSRFSGRKASLVR
jgi:uncharacterized membrane protein